MMEAWRSFPNAKIITLGDFNLPNLSWDSNGVCILDNSHSWRANIIEEYLSLCNVQQHNFIKNTRGHILDLVFSSLTDIHVYSAHDALVPCDEYHPALQLMLPLSAPIRQNSESSSRLCFERADYDAINDYLGHIDWDLAISELSVDEATEFLHHHLKYSISTFVPSHVYVKSSYPAWFSKELISIIRAKKAAHRKYKYTNSFADYMVFSHLRVKCKSLSSTCWNNFINTTECTLANDPNLFWKFIKNVKTAEPRASHILHENRLLDDKVTIANCFADYFESVYTSSGTDSACRVNLNLNHSLDLLSLDITIGEVYKEIDNLSLSCTAGADGIPALFLKSCIFVFARILWLIFNYSLKNGIFPLCWKRCLVTPVFKGGDRQLVTNYRPICKQNIMPKIFEGIIAKKLSSLCRNVINRTTRIYAR
ncbi:PREDICTED: RNA-directed DNA polymerase from mobile element jockey-like [Vollenhovia emeryi]|uniref:RNA-directed DNA polymerase from mobile element jockey-like n=1 Tax=Vollenhovia emeryi TaxID=411798 RepID=UPI0005F3D463|nr:PREDICTED: RNA-directed DNA polymerase from mobile element jockey-like [Vollenhovia emeryi]